jgi:hypothetical protein
MEKDREKKPYLDVVGSVNQWLLQLERDPVPAR